jgi:hypothetical protein
MFNMEPYRIHGNPVWNHLTNCITCDLHIVNVLDVCARGLGFEGDLTQDFSACPSLLSPMAKELCNCVEYQAPIIVWNKH